MSYLKHSIVLFNWSLFLLYALLSFLGWNGNIHFGTGLGDLIYVVLVSLICVTLLLFNLFAHKLNQKNKITVSILFTLLLFYFIYALTIGRGSEVAWNGKVFFF